MTFSRFIRYNAPMAMTGFSNPVQARLQRASGRCKEAARAKANYLPEPGLEGNICVGAAGAPDTARKRAEAFSMILPNGSGTAIIRLPPEMGWGGFSLGMRIKKAGIRS